LSIKPTPFVSKAADQSEKKQNFDLRSFEPHRRLTEPLNQQLRAQQQYESTTLCIHIANHCLDFTQLASDFFLFETTYCKTEDSLT
jgi:hypothetical protein